ncbi:thioesterase II family protein [Nocardia sp. NBC_01377]|uniref:thioesterase II family protein n=1 Tax=Nocardia sp. NBC_01377 TaxID=2903595 RepID=UPI00386C552F
MAKAVGPEYDVFSMQYPGRQDRRLEPLLGSIADPVDGLLPELMETVGGRNFSLFGRSMGSVVAFETCRRLERHTEARPRMLPIDVRPLRRSRELTALTEFPR